MKYTTKLCWTILLKLLATVAFAVATLTPTIATAETGDSVMQAAYEQGRQYSNQQAEVEMIITNQSGKQTERGFRMKHKIFRNRTKSLMRFFRPAGVKGTGLLSETLDAENIPRQWLYLPALRSAKRLNADDQNKSFMGSDFTVGDIAGRLPSRDTHTITAKDADKIYITSRPKDSSEFYSKLEVEMLSSIMVPAKVVFYDRSGAKLKTLENKRIKKLRKMYVVTESLMTNHQTGGATTIKKSKIDIDSRISANSVGLKGLKSG